MARTSVDRMLAEAAKILDVWRTNPELGLGTLTLEQFQEAIGGAEQATAAVESKRTELTGLLNTRDDLLGTLNELISRTRSGIRAVYGPDSSQYQQSGGTRKSERKPPKRKAKPNSTNQG